jgi:hypothetical protein
VRNGIPCLALSAFLLAAGSMMQAADHEAPAYRWPSKPPAILLYPSDGSGTGPTAIPMKKENLVRLPGDTYFSQMARYSKLSGRLYVFDTTRNSCSVSVVDPAQKRVTSELQLSGACGGIKISDDGGRIAVLQLAEGVKNPKVKGNPDPIASIVSIDTMSDKIDAVYPPLSPASVQPLDLSRGFVRSHIGYREPRMPFLMSPSGKHLAVLTTSTAGNQSTRELLLFGPDPARTPTRIPLNMSLEDLNFSKDESKLFVLGIPTDEKKQLGAVGVFGVDDGKLVTSLKVGKNPWLLRRFAKLSGLGVVCEKEVWFLSEEGILSEGKIALNASEEAGGAGVPGLFGRDAMAAGEDTAAIPIVNENGVPKHRVALVDLKKGRVAKLVETGRSSVRRNAILKMVAAGPLAGGIMGAMTPANSADMATSSDGRSLFVLERASHDVTVIELPNGKVSGYLPVHKSTTVIWMAKESRYLFCFGGGDNEVQIIDTTGKEKPQAFDLNSGDLVRSYISDDSPQVKLVKEKATFIWDGVTGKLISGKIPGAPAASNSAN